MKVSKIKTLIPAPEDAVQYYITSNVMSIAASESGVPVNPNESITVTEWKKAGKTSAVVSSDHTLRLYTVLNGTKTSFGQSNCAPSFSFTAASAEGKDSILAELLDSSNNIVASLSIPVKKQGKSAITYEIVPSVTVLNANSAGVIYTEGITIEVYRSKGDVRALLALGSTTKTDGKFHWIRYRRDGGTWYNASHSGTTASIISSAVQATQGYLEIQLVCGEIFSSALSTVLKSYPALRVLKDGQRGLTGKQRYYDGAFDSTKEYTSDDRKEPYVSFDYQTVVTQNGQQVAVTRTSYHLLVADSNRVNGTLVPPRPLQDAVGVWEEIESSFKYLITEAFFTQFAKLGAAIFNGDWMLSQYGKALYEQEEGDYDLLYQGFVVGDGEGVTVNMQFLSQVFIDTTEDDYHNWLVDDDVSVSNPSDAAWEWEYWTTHGFSNTDSLRRLAYLCYVGVQNGYTEEQLLAIAKGQGFTVFDPANMRIFSPNIALDFLTGKSYFNETYVRGTVAVPTLRITRDNYSRYVQTKDNSFGYTYQYVYIPKNVGMVQLEYTGTSGWGIRICMPEIDEDKVGTELIIINATSAPHNEPNASVSGETVKIVSGVADPRAVVFGDENAWLMCGIACNGLHKYVDYDNQHNDINTVGCLAIYDLPPATMMRFMSVSVRGGVRGWVKISTESMN